MLVPSNELAHPPLDPVADDCISHPGRHCDADPAMGFGPGIAHEPEKQEVIRVNFTAALLYVNVFRALAEPLALGKRRGAQGRYFFAIVTTRRLRPLARRRLITWRPWCVFIRFRKPWVRFRRMLDGWYVRLLTSASFRLGEKRSGMDSRWRWACQE